MFDSSSPEFGASSVSAEPSSGRSATEFVTEVTHAATGVTYHFSEPIEIGYYWNGDIFAVNNGGDIIIESITPESGSLTDGRVSHGAVLQPDDATFRAFDSATPGDYELIEEHNVDPGNTGQPLVISHSAFPDGASLVKAVSLDDLSESRDRSVIDEFSVLTIVSEAPPENAFRPPVAGADKVSHYTTDDLDFSKLQNVDILDYQTDIAAFDLYTTATFVSWTTSADPARYIHPNKYHDGYGDYQMDAMVDAFMALHSSYPEAEKADLYAALVQTGIDYAGKAQDGGIWHPDGGHSNHIKPFVVLAASALNSADLAAIANPATGAYSEDKQFRYVDESLISAELYDYGGNKNPKLGVEYQDAQLGTPEWFLRADGDRADPSLEAAYRWINSDNLPITALVMEMLGNGEGREIWNNEAYFDYADRVQHIYDASGRKQGAAWKEFIETYAGQFSTRPDWEGVPEAVTGLEVKANGPNISVSIDGARNDGGSEIIRTDVRYSADRENWTVLEDVPDNTTITDLPDDTLYYVQARYVNAHGEGPWSGNTLQGRNENIFNQLLEAGFVTQEDVENNGGYSLFFKTGFYRDLLRDVLDGAESGAEASFIAGLVNGAVLTGSGISFASGDQDINENVEIGTIVGELIGSEGDKTLTYEMIGASDYFALDGLNLITTAEINYEETSEHILSFRIDDGVSVHEDELTITINDVAEAVTDFVVSIAPIGDNTAVGSVVGTFSAYDDDGEEITFKSSNNPNYDNALFAEYFDIVGEELILEKALDLDVFSSLSLLFYTSTPSSLGLNWTHYTIDIVGLQEPSAPDVLLDQAFDLTFEGTPDEMIEVAAIRVASETIVSFTIPDEVLSQPSLDEEIDIAVVQAPPETIASPAAPKEEVGATIEAAAIRVASETIVSFTIPDEVLSQPALDEVINIAVVQAPPETIVSLAAPKKEAGATTADKSIEVATIRAESETIVSFTIPDELLSQPAPEATVPPVALDTIVDQSTPDEASDDAIEITTVRTASETIVSFAIPDEVLSQPALDDVIDVAVDSREEGLGEGFRHDIIVGHRGDDLISGGKGRDDLSGNDGQDTLLGGRGRDALDGGHGRDDLRGQKGHDYLFGGGGKDALKGGAGKDVLSGGGGQDELTGGKGRDYFEFSRGDGFDTITDFRQRIDKISIDRGANKFEDLIIQQRGDDVLIRFSNVKIRVEDQDVADFSAADFIF